MKTAGFFPLLLFLVYSAAVLQTPSASTDTINTSQIFRDGDTLISSGGDFAFGYFTPGASTYRYLGIWYNTITVQTVVWVANRISPLPNRTSGSLRLVNPGILTLVDEVNNLVLWSTNSSSSTSAPHPIAQLLDSGNLVIKNRNDTSNFLWQSFDYPSDTLLPGMKLGWDLDNRVEYFLSSWKSDDDPSPGEFTYRVDPTGYPQSVLRRGGSQLYRTGPWDGITFGGTNLHPNPIYSFGLVMNDRQVYYHYQLLDKSVISRLTLSQNGVGQRWTWTNQTQGWVYYLVTQRDNCDSYGLCGSYGLCNVANIPVCGCLSKFEPRDQGSWDKTDWSKGCVRRKPLSCVGDGFLKYPGLKLPDTRSSWFNRSISLDECRGVCSRNCSCTAYSSLDVSRGGSGCLLWFGDLVDIKEMAPDGLDLYIRMAASELESKGSRGKVLLVSLLLVAAIVLIGVGLVLWLQRRKKVASRLLGITGDVVNNPNDHRSDHHRKDLDLPSFELSTLTKATDNFWVANKLGEGGFGPVYKGLLEGGQEIAVKRLSRASLQGVDEFKNEVICIGKLQHRNLVKLLGYCIEGDENILVYEYMTNKSLDLILFDPAKSGILDWPKRFGIINGIARGLLYLHQDSRLRIIHRDLKASNILLDEDMNPKISDFGLARSFGGNETGANTSRVVGTYGYMSPEYAVDGLFSVKSDVFSFGVLLLEIVSGTRNRGFARRDHHFNLLGHAWMLHKDGRSSELIGFDIGDDESSYLSQAIRSIHVGLLCVQQRPEERPSMSSVVMMLGNNGDLPESKQPGFFTEREIMSNAAETSVSSNAAVSTNDMSITLLQPR